MDQLKEIFSSIRQHKLRVLLTGFGIFWGIFMLLILIGVGTGLKKGVYRQFEGYSTNSFFIWGGKASLPYQGMNPGRYIHLTNEDMDLLKQNITGLECLNAATYLPGEFTVNYKDKSGSFTILGTLPELVKIENIFMEKGRFINLFDCRAERKIAVIGLQVNKILFDGGNPVGKYIDVNGVYFKVVGVFNKVDIGNSDKSVTDRIFLPLATLQQTFNLKNRINSMGVCVKDNVSAKAAETKAVELLKKKYQLAPLDQNGIRSYNTAEWFLKIINLFRGINAFIWMVGIGTIMSGIVGVSNIMLITVVERTREIGIRKAVGATPFSIISLILQETLLLTFIFGYLGFSAGVFSIETIAYVMDKFKLQSDYFTTPEINFTVALLAFALIALAGLIAGLVPAYRAASINPIDALRSE